MCPDMVVGGQWVHPVTGALWSRLAPHRPPFSSLKVAVVSQSPRSLPLRESSVVDGNISGPYLHQVKQGQNCISTWKYRGGPYGANLTREGNAVHNPCIEIHFRECHFVHSNIKWSAFEFLQAAAFLLHGKQDELKWLGHTILKYFWAKLTLRIINRSSMLN